MQSDSEKNKILFMRLFSSISQIDWEKMMIEIENFQKDIKNHKSGVLLWVKEEYYNIMLLISALHGNIFDGLISTFLPNMKEVVDEYFIFHDDVKARNPELYQEEIEESNKLVFENEVQPIDILITKDGYIKNLNRKFSEVLKSYSTLVQDYTENLKPLMISYGKQFEKEYQFLAQNRELELKLKDFKFDMNSITSVSEALQELGKQLPKDFQNFISSSKETNKRVEEIQKETLSNFPELTKKFGNLTENFMENYDVNDAPWAHQRLSLIQYIDSFHIIFTKFIARLFHILSNNNNNYAKKTPQIVINPKKHYNTRPILEQILKREMSQEYPKISEYLLSMLKCNEYRNIEAHQIPKIRISDGIAYIPMVGTTKETKLNLRKANTIINTYSYFIEALNLIKNYKL